MTAIAKAHPNIALVKYWGKRSEEDMLPDVGSISITVSGMVTTTRLSFAEEGELSADEILLNGESRPDETAKVSSWLDRFRQHWGHQRYARVNSDNDFPTGAGLASSASGFAALTAAAFAEAELDVSSDDLTRWARRGSVSAARSFHGGFVELFREGDSYASQLMPQQDWPLDVHIAITSSKRKSVGSSAGMKTSAEQCPYYSAWIATQDADLKEARQAILSKDFDRLAAITEVSCLKMHSVMIATPPGLLYWNSGTLDLIHRIRELRSQGVGVTYTIDAGPQLKVICEPGNSHKVKEALEDATGIERVIHAGLGGDLEVARQ